jgi:hypothetical protein
MLVSFAKRRRGARPRILALSIAKTSPEESRHLLGQWPAIPLAFTGSSQPLKKRPPAHCQGPFRKGMSLEKSVGPW